VQVGVAGAGVAVREGGGDEPAGLDLADALGAFTGEEGVVLQVGQGVLDGALVGAFDRGRDRLVGDRPQRADALDGGEGQVVAGDRVRAGSRVLGDGRGDLAGVDRVPAELLPEELDGDLGADPRAVLQGAGASWRRPRCTLMRGDPLRDPPAELRDVVGVTG
jgi:hypothetical protein